MANRKGIAMDWLPVISRWAHVGSVVVLVGGAFFLRYILAPAAAALPDAEHAGLRERLMNRWRPLVHTLVALIFFSGCFNFYVRMNAERPWHMLAGIKVLLGLFVLFVASALVGRSAGLAKIRENWKFWLQVNLLVAFLAIFLSGYMKFLNPKPKVAEPAASTASK
jgi:hypothetical protein